MLPPFARAARGCALVALLAAVPGHGAQPPAATYVHAGRIIDPYSEVVREDAAIVLAGDCIVAVGAASAIAPPAGATRIDWSAFTVLPGLVDAHTHVGFATDGAPGSCPWERSSELLPEVLLPLARENALAMLRSGVTTAVDKGASSGIDFDLRDEIAAGVTPGPRLLAAGDAVYRIPDEANPYPGLVRRAEEIAPEIRRQALAGSDLIKVYADLCSDRRLECEPSFTPEELAIAAAEAHRLGLRIAIHAYGAGAGRAAIAAGADSLEHAVGLDAEALAAMARQGTVFIPTIEHNRYYAENFAWFGYTAEDAARLSDFADRGVATARAAHRAGVRLGLGSDAVFTMFGQNPRELRALVAAGLDAMAVLRAATVNGAASVGRESEVGRVAPGWLGDLIAVEGDPLADPAVVAGGVAGVLAGGRLVDLGGGAGKDTAAAGRR